MYEDRDLKRWNISRCHPCHISSKPKSSTENVRVRLLYNLVVLVSAIDTSTAVIYTSKCITANNTTTDNHPQSHIPSPLPSHSIPSPPIQPLHLLLRLLKRLVIKNWKIPPLTRRPPRNLNVSQIDTAHCGGRGPDCCCCRGIGCWSGGSGVLVGEVAGVGGSGSGSGALGGGGGDGGGVFVEVKPTEIFGGSGGFGCRCSFEV